MYAQGQQSRDQKPKASEGEEGGLVRARLEDALAQEQGEAVAESPARDDESEREAKPPGALHQSLHHQRQKRVVDGSAQPFEDLGGSEEAFAEAFDDTIEELL